MFKTLHVLEDRFRERHSHRMIIIFEKKLLVGGVEYKQSRTVLYVNCISVSEFTLTDRLKI